MSFCLNKASSFCSFELMETDETREKNYSIREIVELLENFINEIEKVFIGKLMYSYLAQFFWL